MTDGHRNLVNWLSATALQQCGNDEELATQALRDALTAVSIGQEVLQDQKDREAKRDQEQMN